MCSRLLHERQVHAKQLVRAQEDIRTRADVQRRRHEEKMKGMTSDEKAHWKQCQKNQSNKDKNTYKEFLELPENEVLRSARQRKSSRRREACAMAKQERRRQRSAFYVYVKGGESDSRTTIVTLRRICSSGLRVLDLFESLSPVSNIPHFDRDMYITFGSKQLNNPQLLLSDYGIVSGATVFVNYRLRAGSGRGGRRTTAQSSRNATPAPTAVVLGVIKRTLTAEETTVIRTRIGFYAEKAKNGKGPVRITSLSFPLLGDWTCEDSEEAIAVGDVVKSVAGDTIGAMTAPQLRFLFFHANPDDPFVFVSSAKHDADMRAKESAADSERHLNETDEQQEAHRVAKLTANMTDKQKESQQARHQTSNMTEGRQEAHRAANLTGNLDPQRLLGKQEQDKARKRGARFEEHQAALPATDPHGIYLRANIEAAKRAAASKTKQNKTKSGKTRSGRHYLHDSTEETDSDDDVSNNGSGEEDNDVDDHDDTPSLVDLMSPEAQLAALKGYDARMKEFSLADVPCCICHERWFGQPMSVPKQGHIFKHYQGLPVCDRCKDEPSVGARTSHPIHKFSIENNMFPGPPHPAFLHLTSLEKLLISPIISGIQVIRPSIFKFLSCYSSIANNHERPCNFFVWLGPAMLMRVSCRHFFFLSS